VLLCSAAPLHAASLDGRSLRFGAGIVSPESLPATPWLLAALRLRARGLSLEAEAGFWSRSEIAFGLNDSIRDVQLGTSLIWSPLRLGRARAVLGAGPAAHFVTSSAGPLVGERAAATSARLGIQSWAALELAIGPRSALFVAGRGDWIFRREREDERERRVYGGVRLGF
jgi:hypothetical protein